MEDVAYLGLSSVFLFSFSVLPLVYLYFDLFEVVGTLEILNVF